MIRTTSKDELSTVLAAHALWLQDSHQGKRANLTGADLRGANLTYADLRVADMYNANLTYAILTGADLSRAIMPDGRAWEDYLADPLAGICDNPEARSRAIAAWGNHGWGECPMSKANGYVSYNDVPEDKGIAVAAFIALFDAGLLAKPEEAE